MRTQVIVVGSAKTNDAERRRPRIRLSGLRLNEIGFVADSLVSVDCRDGSMTLKLEGIGLDAYNLVVKGVMGKGRHLLQVRNECKNRKYIPSIDMMGFWLERYGFSIGAFLAIMAEPGMIQLRILNVDGMENHAVAG